MFKIPSTSLDLAVIIMTSPRIKMDCAQIVVGHRTEINLQLARIKINLIMQKDSVDHAMCKIGILRVRKKLNLIIRKKFTCLIRQSVSKKTLF